MRLSILQNKRMLTGWQVDKLTGWQVNKLTG